MIELCGVLVLLVIAIGGPACAYIYYTGKLFEKELEHTYEKDEWLTKYYSLKFRYCDLKMDYDKLNLDYKDLKEELQEK